MKVQNIDTERGERYILLNDSYEPVDHVNRFLKFCDITGKSPNTLRSYAFHLKAYYEFMERHGYSILNLCANEGRGPIEILSEFMAYLECPNAASKVIDFQKLEPAHSNSSINVIVGTVLSFYRYLSQNKEIQEIDFYRQQLFAPQVKSFLSELVGNRRKLYHSILRKRIPERKVEYITRSQFNELFFLCNNLRDRLLVSLLFEGGLRISEALGIHLQDLNQLEDGIVKIVPRENNENGARVKNHAAGQILLPPYVIDIVLDYINTEILDYSSDFLFLNLCGPSKGAPLKANTVTGLFNRLSQQLGYKVTPHMLRHGFATEKLEAGWQMEDISAYLRHKSLQSTQVYAHYSDVLKKEKMRDYLDAQNIGYGGVLLHG